MQTFKQWLENLTRRSFLQSLGGAAVGTIPGLAGGEEQIRSPEFFKHHVYHVPEGRFKPKDKEQKRKWILSKLTKFTDTSQNVKNAAIAMFDFLEGRSNFARHSRSPSHILYITQENTQFAVAITDDTRRDGMKGVLHDLNLHIEDINRGLSLIRARGQNSPKITADIIGHNRKGKWIIFDLQFYYGDGQGKVRN